MSEAAHQVFRLREAKSFRLRALGAGANRWVERIEAASLRAALVTGNTFPFMVVNPLLGRYTTKEDAKPGAPWALVLSYKVWNKHY